MIRKIVVIASGGEVTGPGEGEQFLVYEVDGNSIKEAAREANPAINATMHRGLHALKRAKEIGATDVIVAEIGPPGYRAARNWGLNIYIVPEGTRVDEAISMVIDGKIHPASGPTHLGHHEHDLESGT